MGKQFEIDYTKAKADDKCVYQGNNYRISILTERLVRLEYSPTGAFVDAPTQLVKQRDLGYPEFRVNQDANYIEIVTKYFKLSYYKRQPFEGTKVDPMKNLRITLNSMEKDKQRDWYYKNPEARNMNGNMVSTDVPTNKILNRGLFSLEGFASIDDTPSKILNTDGTFINRNPGTIDIYVFMYDTDFKQALQDYYKLTGYPELIPRYALGNWWSRNTTYSDTSLDELLNNFDKKKIPLSILLLDKDWHYRSVGDKKDLRTGFTFNKELFPNPKATIDKLHSKNIRVGLNINPTEGIFPHE